MDEKKTNNPEQEQLDELRKDLAEHPERFTLAGDPLPIDLETGEILKDQLTPAQQEALARAQLKLVNSMAHVFPGKEIAETIKQNSEAIRKALNLDGLRESINKFYETFVTEETREHLREAAETLKQASDVLQELEELEPYINAELKKPEYNGRTLDEITEAYTLIGLKEARHDPETEFYKLMEAASAARNADRETQIQAYQADKLDFPTDKVNLFAWDLKETGDQMKFKFDLARAGSGDVATALFSLSFDDDPNLTITKEINHFDKRVMSACGTAYNSGKPIITATGIYYAMGGTSERPAQKHIDNINNSLTKMEMAKMFLDNTVEAGTYKYPKFRKEDRLLHIKRVSRIVNGKTTDSAIQILEEPVLMSFARQRKQISTIPIKVLQSPVTKTNNHLRIEDYLLWRIVQQKNDIQKLRDQQKKKYTQNRQHQLKAAGKLIILLSTFYERTGNAKKDATGKKRARETAADYLNHYKSEAGEHWITDYKVDADRIIITLPIE